METRENSAVSAVLRVIPDELQPRQNGATAQIAYGDRTWTFLPIWIGEGLPADAHRAPGAALARAEEFPDAIPVFVAKRVTPGASALLETWHASWVDMSGRARIVGPGALYITRLEPIRTDAKRAFTWSGAEQIIAEVILAQHVAGHRTGPAPIGRVTALADASNISLAHAARVLRHFDEVGFTAKTGAERGSSASRELREPGRMLSEWAGNYASGMNTRRTVELHVPWRDAEDSLPAVVDALSECDWAVTGEVAADRIAPHLTSIATLDICVPNGQLDAASGRLRQQADVTQVDTGGRIRVHEAGRHVFGLTSEVQGLRVVSPVRVYSDLLRGRGRAAEAAEHLREVAIGF